MTDLEDTLEPVQPIEETPYGALVIRNNLLCTPTSLCTWSDTKPAVYCRLLPHTLNPVCQEVNKGIGLIGCYEEATCGGMVPVSKTQRILEQNPHYSAIIHAKEKKLKTIQKSQPLSTPYTIVVATLVVLSLLVVVLLGHHAYQKWFTRTRKRSASGRTWIGAGKTGKPSNK